MLTRQQQGRQHPGAVQLPDPNKRLDLPRDKVSLSVFYIIQMPRSLARYMHAVQSTFVYIVRPVSFARFFSHTGYPLASPRHMNDKVL